MIAAAIAAALPATADAAAKRICTHASPEVQRPLHAMIAAMQERDAEAIGKALSTSVQPEIVYYWGETVSGRAAIVQWHREWFAEKGWTVEQHPVSHALVDDRLATLTVKVKYVKNPQRQFLLLINYSLVKEARGWSVARIQQTLLKGPD